MNPPERIVPKPADAVAQILESMRIDLLLTIGVARMAPRAGMLAVQLIKGVQLPFMGQTYTYSPTRGRTPSVFDVCDPEGLRPGWTESSSTVPAGVLLDALAYGSEHHAWGGRMWLPTFFSLWEEDYRHQLAAVHECKPRDFRIPFFGDLRKLRNDVAHRGGVARPDGAASCEVLQWFEVGEPIVLDHAHFKEVIEKFPWTDLRERPTPAPAGKTNLAAGIDDDLALRLRQGASKDGLKVGTAVEMALEAWLAQRESELE